MRLGHNGSNLLVIRSSEPQGASRGLSGIPSASRGMVALADEMAEPLRPAASALPFTISSAASVRLTSSSAHQIFCSPGLLLIKSSAHHAAFLVHFQVHFQVHFLAKFTSGENTPDQNQ